MTLYLKNRMKALQYHTEVYVKEKHRIWYGDYPFADDIKNEILPKLNPSGGVFPDCIKRTSNVKADMTDWNITSPQIQKLQQYVINELLSLKKQWKDTIVSSDYYLKQIPIFFENGHGPECNAGHSFVTVTPDGFIKRCSEMPAVCHYTDFKPGFFNKTECTTCWFGCRGETQAPVMEKAKEIIGL